MGCAKSKDAKPAAKSGASEPYKRKNSKGSNASGRSGSKGSGTPLDVLRAASKDSKESHPEGFALPSEYLDDMFCHVSFIPQHSNGLCCTPFVVSGVDGGVHIYEYDHEFSDRHSVKGHKTFFPVLSFQ